jgi:opacity protein-like surface antigen
MKTTHLSTMLKGLLAVSSCAASTALAGTYSEPAGPPPVYSDKSAGTGSWNWFAGGSIGYLLDYETEMFHAHIGREYQSPSGFSHGFFLEAGYAEGLESQWARTVVGEFNGSPTALETGLASFDGEVEFIPVTFNYKLEGCITDSLKWYAGLGAGASFVDADYSLAITGAFPTIGRRFSDDDVVFTGQVFAGIVWEATDNFELYTGLRYIYVDDPEFNDTFTGSALNVELDDYLVEGGFRFNF